MSVSSARADKPVRPARRGKVLSAGRLIAKALLEIKKGARKIGHQTTESVMFRLLFWNGPTLAATTFCMTGRRGISH